MFPWLEQATRLLESGVGELDAEVLTASEAEACLAAFVRAEHLCAAGKVLCAGRAIETHAHTRAGFRAGDWLARALGSTLSEALAVLDTARKLPQLSGLDEALRKGEVSTPQAAAVAKGSGGDKDLEQQLLKDAKSSSLKALQDKARRLEAPRDEESERIADENRLQAQRFLRTRVGSDGAVRGEFALAPLPGSRLLAAIEAQQKKFFDEARRLGREEPSSAYAADALASLAERPSGEATRSDTIVLRVDLSAFRRGAAWPGETCEIPGVGPVPVATARQVLGDSLLKLVITNGVDIRTVSHYGRVIPTALRTALEERDPVCVVPGCGSSFQLEIDHWRVPFADGGLTDRDGCCRICRHHHRLKTHRGYKLIGGPGRWRLLTPEGHDASVNPFVSTGPPTAETPQWRSPPPTGTSPPPEPGEPGTARPDLGEQQSLLVH